MTGFLLLKGTVNALLGILELLFLARALLSWFQDMGGDAIATLYEITYQLTEPLVIPMRALIDRFSWAHSVPIDFAFLFTFCLISLLEFIL